MRKLRGIYLIVVVPVVLTFASAPGNADSSFDYRSFSSHSGIPLTRQPVSQNENNLYAHSLNDQAYQLIRQGSMQEAEGLVRQALAYDPSFVCAHCNLGYILNKTGRPKEALPHLLFAYRLDPNEPAILQSLAASYQLQGDFETAISAYNEYLARFPNAQDAAFIADLITHLKMESANKAIVNANQSVNKSKTGGGPVDSKSTTSAVQNFSWDKRHVKVFVQPASGVTGYRPNFDVILRDAFRAWSQAGVISFEFTARREDADIECVWTDNIKRLSSVSEGGETVLKERNNTVSHAEITLLTMGPGNQNMTDRDVQALCLHEVGHALGMMKHSLNPDDVMFCTLETSHPSVRDLKNLKALYQEARNPVESR